MLRILTLAFLPFLQSCQPGSHLILILDMSGFELCSFYPEDMHPAGISRMKEHESCKSQSQMTGFMERFVDKLIDWAGEKKVKFAIVGYGFDTTLPGSDGKEAGVLLNFGLNHRGKCFFSLGCCFFAAFFGINRGHPE